MGNTNKLNMHVERYTRSSALLKQSTPTCCQRIIALVDAKGWTKTKFCNKTLLDEAVYDRIMREYNSVPSLRTLIAICAAMDLCISAALSLLASAGYILSEAIEEHRAYMYILRDMAGATIGERNEFLVRVGVEPLGSRTNQSRKAAAV